MKIEREALKKETDDKSKQRLELIGYEITGLESKAKALEDKWKSEKQGLSDLTGLKDKLDKARIEVEIAKRNGEYERAGELQYGLIPELEQKIKSAEEASKNKKSGISETVTEENIASVVSKWTGIPVDKMLEGEREKLLHMEDFLAKRVVGQKGGDCGRFQRCSPFSCRHQRKPPADRVVFVLRADRRRQNRTQQSFGRIFV